MKYEVRKFISIDGGEGWDVILIGEKPGDWSGRKLMGSFQSERKAREYAVLLQLQL
jgi:hypothetical protein